MKIINQKAFTLIELLVVIAIVSIISSILFVAIDPKAQANNAMDARRITLINQIEKALELYRLDNGRYPKAGTTTSWGITNYHGTDNTNIAEFESDLNPYLKLNLSDDPIGEYWGHPGEVLFLYKSVPADNYQSYGMGINLNSPTNNNLEQNDGGFLWTAYEVGSTPRYCKEKYNGEDDKWWFSGDTRCAGGN